jgi:glutamate--cysteine ligase
MQPASGEHSPRIEDVDQLVELYRSACTKRADWRVGLEHEKFGLWRESSRSPTYEGPRGIRRVLELFVERHGWSPVYDGEPAQGAPVIELTKDGASITLEPGGQLELSGSPQVSIHAICAELDEHIRDARRIGDELGIDWIGLGAHPTSLEPDIPWMPKARYAIMGRYLPTRGRHALDMMKRTCTVQASFDFESEADCAEKMRLAMGLSPIVVAIFASSPVSAGHHNGFLSERAKYWQEMDPDRCGFFPEIFDEGWGFRDYVERVLDTPMFFIKRGGKLIDYAGRSFRDFLARGFDGHEATIADFELHGSTLFPEARLKRVIEVRGADSGPRPMLCALPALWKGILYDAASSRDALSLVRDWTQTEREELWADVSRRALDARIRGTRLLDLARELVRLSNEGLARQNVRSAKGNDETFYLRALEHYVVEEGRCPAAVLLDRFEHEWHHDVQQLIEATRY